MSRATGLLLVVVALLAGALLFRRRQGPSPPPPVVGLERLARGRDAAAAACAGCHALPPPEALDQATWALGVLPEMGLRMGQAQPATLDPALRAAAPKGALLSPEGWADVCAYYLALAPAELDPPARAPAASGLPSFAVEPLRVDLPPLTTAVRIDPIARVVHVGTAGSVEDPRPRPRFTTIGRDGRVLRSVEVASPPVDIRPAPRQLGAGLVLTLIGSYEPSDARQGAVVLLPGDDGPPRALIGALPRPSQTEVADLDGDGRDDLLVCSFGNAAGGLAWYDGGADGPWREHVLASRPGAVGARAVDVDRDGDLDVVALFAQAREALLLLVNEGAGRFREVELAAFHPAWGSSGLEVTDLDGDGDLDLLVANGDAGDQPHLAPSVRPYHGVRRWLGDGRGGFREGAFDPLPGAYRVVARDFDRDGDLDVAATSFFPDLVRAPGDGFVLFEAGAPPRTFVGSDAARWLTLDAGDLDGDGDEDLVLGAFLEGPTFVPTGVRAAWRAAPPAIVLRNLAR